MDDLWWELDIRGVSTKCTEGINEMHMDVKRRLESEITYLLEEIGSNVG
jgi:hypothetical protein